MFNWLLFYVEQEATGSQPEWDTKQRDVFDYMPSFWVAFVHKLNTRALTEGTQLTKQAAFLHSFLPTSIVDRLSASFFFLLNVIMFYCKVHKQCLSCFLRDNYLNFFLLRTIVFHQDCMTTEELQALHILECKWLESHFWPRRKDPLASVPCCLALGGSTWHTGSE